MGIVNKNVALLERFFLQAPAGPWLKAKTNLCRVSLTRNQIMKSGTNLTGRKGFRVCFRIWKSKWE